MLASILAISTAPAALAAASVTPSAMTNVARSSTGAGAPAGSYTFTEATIDGWSDGGAGFVIDVTIHTPGVTYLGSFAQSTGPGSLGLSAVIVSPTKLQIKAMASDRINIEQFIVQGIRVTATCVAPLGPIDTRYTYTATPGDATIFGGSGSPPYPFPALGTVVSGSNCPNPAETRDVCALKFHDIDGNGKRDGGTDPLLADWVLTVTDGNNNVVMTVKTNAEKEVCFPLPIGTYTITETLSTVNGPWTPTTQAGLSRPLVVPAGTTPLPIVEFGNRRTAAEGGRICVTKFDDRDGDGQKDEGEPLLAWDISISQGGVQTDKDSTSLSAGKPLCFNVTRGTYTVTEATRPGWLSTTGGVTQTVEVGVGETKAVTFGNKRCCQTFTFRGGVLDKFVVPASALKTEYATPVPNTGPPSSFDAATGPNTFRHRFYLGASPGSCIESAKLIISLKGLKATPRSKLFNDTVGLKPGGAAGWTRQISSVPGIGWAGPWMPGKLKKLTLDLEALPTSGGTQNIVPALDVQRVLDITVQDHTSVDYIDLIVEYCDCAAKTSSPSGIPASQSH